MSETGMRDAVRAIYRGLIGTAALAALPLRPRDARLSVFYGGARAGDFGGTLVKVRLLQSRFPEHRVAFSLLYMLSNAIYLPQAIVDRIKLSGVPVVLNQNGVFYRGWYAGDWQRENARMAKLHAAASFVFYQSEFCKRCAEKFLGARAGRSEILYNAVDTQYFAPAAERLVGAPFTFVITGKFDKAMSYRLRSSIAGLAAARQGGLDVQLVVAGVIDPDVAIAAHAQVEGLGMTDAVAFAGPYTWKEAPSIYRSADAYLMTKHNDPCPNSVLEAMSSGLPVLYSASGGVPELVGEHAGIGLAVPGTFEENLVPDAVAVAEGMERIMRQHAELGAAARRRAVERFDLSGWFDRHDAVFRECLRDAA
jgi:glycosyltransferase involved in cell wall biosynthesis